MTSWFTLIHTDTVTGKAEFCEVEGDKCYEVFRTQTAAQAKADELNARANDNDYHSRYTVADGPACLIPVFDDAPVSFTPVSLEKQREHDARMYGSCLLDQCAAAAQGAKKSAKSEIEIKISQLRDRESALRADLVSSLVALANAATRAAYKISTREYEDGVAGIDRDIENFRETQDELDNVSQDIKFAEWELQDYCYVCDRPAYDCACVENGGTY